MLDDEGKPMRKLVNPPPFEPTSEQCPGCALIEEEQQRDQKATKESPKALFGRHYGLVPFEAG